MTSRQIAPEHILVGQEEGTHILLTIFADELGPAAQFVCDAAGAIEHPRQAALADHRMIAVSASWSQHQPYGRVLETLCEAQRLAEAAGWPLTPAVEGVLDTGALIDDLRVVDEWPAEPAASGYNAAAGFVFEAEQLGAAVAYSGADFEQLRQLAMAVYRLLS